MTRSVRIETTGELTRREFWLRWLPTLLSFPVGGALAMGLVGHLDSVTAALLGGAISGVVIGGGQWLALRRVLAGATWWIGATAVGQAIGLAVGAPLVDFETGPGDLVLQGAIAGLAIGALQTIVLYRGTGTGLWWAPVMVPLWALGWFIMWAGRIHVEEQFFNFGLYGAITYTILSGFGLVSLLHLPRSGSETLQPAGGVAQ
jgi:hypothetical protein